MFKNLLIIITLLLLNNCASTGSALLGPIFTGAKTGSIYQASLSYGTGKILKDMIPEEIYSENSSYNKNPIIIAKYKVEEISFSEVNEPEPLP